MNGAGTIQRFGSTGAPIGRYDGSNVPGGFGALLGIVVSRSTSDIYVLDTTGPSTSPPYPAARDRVVMRVRDTNPVGIAGARPVSALHPLRSGNIEVFLECRDAVGYCDVSGSTTTYVPRVRKATAARRKVFFGKDVEKRIRPNTRAKLKLPVPRRARRLIRRARAHHRTTRVHASLFAFNPAGNKHASKFLTLKIR